MMFEINFSHQPFLVVYLFVVPFVQIQNASAPMVGDDGLLLDLRNLFEWLGPDVWKDSGKVSVDFSHEMIEFRTWKSDLFKLHSSCHCLSNIAKCDSFDEDGWLEKAGWKKHGQWMKMYFPLKKMTFRPAMLLLPEATSSHQVGKSEDEWDTHTIS